MVRRKRATSAWSSGYRSKSGALVTASFEPRLINGGLEIPAVLAHVAFRRVTYSGTSVGVSSGALFGVF